MGQLQVHTAVPYATGENRCGHGVASSVDLLSCRCVIPCIPFPTEVLPPSPPKDHDRAVIRVTFNLGTTFDPFVKSPSSIFLKELSFR